MAIPTRTPRRPRRFRSLTAPLGSAVAPSVVYRQRKRQLRGRLSSGDRPAGRLLSPFRLGPDSGGKAIGGARLDDRLMTGVRVVGVFFAGKQQTERLRSRVVL